VLPCFLPPDFTFFFLSLPAAPWLARLDFTLGFFPSTLRKGGLSKGLTAGSSCSVSETTGGGGWRGGEAGGGLGRLLPAWRMLDFTLGPRC